jgi:hypothetical protein
VTFCLLWDVLVNIKEVAHNWAIFFCCKSYVGNNFHKSEFGYILGDFFTNASGHPGQNKLRMLS